MGSAQQRRDQEPRLAQASREFEQLLRKCLPECARGRWGLFGQHERVHGIEFTRKYYSWPEAERVVELAEEIVALRAETGDTSSFPLLDRFIALRAVDSALPEPKLALRFLQDLKRDELADKVPSDRAFWT